MSVYMYNYVNFLSFIFRDLIEQFRPWLKDALDLRKSDVRERERGRERDEINSKLQCISVFIECEEEET